MNQERVGFITMSLQIEIQKCSIILASIILLWNGTECLRFDLESGYTKCITEDIRSNSMTVGKYQIVKPDDAMPSPDDTHNITVRVKKKKSAFSFLIFFYFACYGVVYILFRIKSVYTL